MRRFIRGKNLRDLHGSSIIDHSHELFWRMDRHHGKLSPEKALSFGERQPALCEICPRSVLLQKDIDELSHKSAAHTMVEIMLRKDPVLT